MGRQGEENQIHPGADDNASGTAAVLELADALAKEHGVRDGLSRPAGARSPVIAGLLAHAD